MNQRPSWCPHKDCNFVYGFCQNEESPVEDQYGMCGGNLKVPTDHISKGTNDKRVCFKFDNCREVTDIMCNDTDLQWFRLVFDKLDGKKTSWMSNL